MEEIPTCQLCKDNFQDLVCTECDSIICEDCHDQPPDNSDHKSNHKVIEKEESSEEEFNEKPKEELKDSCEVLEKLKKFNLND